LTEDLAGRRRDLAALVSELDAITNATGRRGLQLGHAIRVARATLAATAARQREIASAFVELPPTLRRVNTSLRAVRDLATPLVPALAGLRPTARLLPAALDATRRLMPSAKALLDDVRPVVTSDMAPLTALSEALLELGPAARLIEPVLPVLKHLVSTLDASHADLLALLGNWPGAISVAGNTGVETRSLLLGTESLLPALFGVDTPAQSGQLAGAMRVLQARRPDLLRGAPAQNRGSMLRDAAWAMLIATCKTNAFACVAAMDLGAPGSTSGRSSP
jgi:hypothetical protein